MQLVMNNSMMILKKNIKVLNLNTYYLAGKLGLFDMNYK